MVIAGDGLSTVKAEKIMRWNDAEKGMRSSKYYTQNKTIIPYHFIPLSMDQINSLQTSFDKL